MIVRIVTFRLDGIDEEQYQHHAVGIADTFNRWTGLRAKLWLADRAAGVYGGVYLFDGQAGCRPVPFDTWIPGHARRTLPSRICRSGSTTCSSSPPRSRRQASSL